ncbi:MULTISPECIES: DUF2711 family protein [unclassified Paenibacillus]
MPAPRNNLSKDLYYPRENRISEFFIPDILDILSSNGACVGKGPVAFL